MSARYVPKTPTSDMTSERAEKEPLAPSVTSIGPWEPPADSDRALVRDGLARNGAHDLAEILGLAVPGPGSGPVAVPCPTCGAAAGASCTTTAARSRLVHGCHRARKEAA